MCVRACNALVLKLDYLSTTVCQKLHFLLSDAILRILARASCACPRTLRVSAHISREDTQDGVSAGGFKMAAMSPVQLYIGQWPYLALDADAIPPTPASPPGPGTKLSLSATDFKTPTGKSILYLIP